MIIKYFSWVKDIVGKSEETISISPDIDTPEKLIDFLIKKMKNIKKRLVIVILLRSRKIKFIFQNLLKLKKMMK